MILDAMSGFDQPTVLDIGCGHGIDGEKARQTEVARQAGQMWGCEPDQEIRCNDCFHKVFPDLLENAPIPAGSVHVAYTSFVLEHIPDPTLFFKKIHAALAPGGIFLGMTDYRWSFFSCASQIIEWTKLKNVYLNLVQGKRGSQRYENYPTFYRANSESTFRKIAPQFQKYVFSHWHRFGELDFYLPKILRPVGWGVDALSIYGPLPRQIFIVGLQK
jgi:SAM-dependent methyltransferase